METILEAIQIILGFLLLVIIGLPLLIGLWPILVAILVVGFLYLFWPLSGLLLLAGIIAAALYWAYWG